jgi:hypothetical protein
MQSFSGKNLKEFVTGNIKESVLKTKTGAIGHM